MSTFNTDGLIIDLDEAPATTPPPIPGNQQQKPPEPSLPEKKATSVEDEAVDRLRKQMEAKLAAAEERNRQLNEQMAQERANRLKAEGMARDAGFEKEWSDYTAATAAFDGAKNRIASLKSQWKAAHEAGDLDKAAEAQAQLGVESARLVQFEMAKDQLHDRLEARKKEPPPKQEETAPAHTDPVEQFVTHNKLTAKAAQWFRDNPEFVKDPEKNHLVIAADNAARKAHLKRDSDEYFDYINNYVGLGEGDGGEKQPQKRKPSTPAAPVNGGRGSQFSSSNMDGNRVRMSQHLRDLAEAMYPNLPAADAHKRYAKNTIELIKKGQMPKDFFETH